jgi:lysophospholipase L1-like esterase
VWLLGALGAAVLAAEVALARRLVGSVSEPAPAVDGSYGDGEPLSLAVLGDSAAAGWGVPAAEAFPRVLAEALSQRLRRRIDLQCVAEVGATTADLGRQVSGLTANLPQLAVIIVGANDVKTRVRPGTSALQLRRVLDALQEQGCAVVVGTCPDLGTVRPVKPPLRWVVRQWSRLLAAAQAAATVDAGAVAVQLGELLGADFLAEPHVYFGADRFHPSAAGQRRVVDVLLPAALVALGAESTVHSARRN